MQVLKLVLKHIIWLFGLIHSSDRHSGFVVSAYCLEIVWTIPLYFSSPVIAHFNTPTDVVYILLYASSVSAIVS